MTVPINKLSRLLVPVCFLILVPLAVFGRQEPELMTGLGDHHHHPVRTSVPEAQKFFDQGLRLIYGFNHDEAARAFRRAAELDPQMPMAYWGIAKAVGPNYNLPVDKERARIAHENIQKAMVLAKTLRNTNSDTSPRSPSSIQVAPTTKNSQRPTAMP